MKRDVTGLVGPVIGVVGGSGGVGASTFAAAVATACGALLVDADVDGGGLDVLLGLDHAPGVRWSGLQLAGGSLDPTALRAGVCAWNGCAVLAADVPSLAPAAVTQVLEVGARGGPVVVDLPRRDCPERVAALALCDLAVVVARADVAGMVSAHGVVEALRGAPDEDETVHDVPVGVVVRAGEVPGPEAARLVGGRFLGELATARRGMPGRPSRAVLRVAAGVVAGATGSLPARVVA